MKKILFSLLVLGTVLVSCSKDDPAPTCATSVSGIAGSYKITKVELVTGGVPSDITSSLSACEASGIYRFNADKTSTYTEVGSSCTDSYTGGTWDIVGSNIVIKDDTGSEWYNAPVTSWDCNNLLVSETGTIGGTTVTYVTTFSKQ